MQEEASVRRLIRIVGACAVVLLLSGLLGCGREKILPKDFLFTFETVSTLTVYADSEEDFEKAAKYFEDELTKYHRLFDIYNNYDGINNLKTINVMQALSRWRLMRKLLIC